MAGLLKKYKKIMSAFLDIVLPPSCYVCRESCSGKYGLCDNCIIDIQKLKGPACRRCGSKVLSGQTLCAECSLQDSPLDKNWSACRYDGKMRECIHLFKYKGYLGLVDIFGDIVKEFVENNKIYNEVDIIAPVPLHPAKRRERNYNHAEILASAISKNFSIPIDLKNLKKIKWSHSQSELKKEERKKNVKNTFILADARPFQDKRVLLVDDVYTTGATLRECARILKESGAAKVFSITLAKVINSKVPA